MNAGSCRFSSFDHDDVRLVAHARSCLNIDAKVSFKPFSALPGEASMGDFWAWLQIDEGDVLNIKSCFGQPVASIKDTPIPMDVAASMHRPKR